MTWADLGDEGSLDGGDGNGGGGGGGVVVLVEVVVLVVLSHVQHQPAVLGDVKVPGHDGRVLHDLPLEFLEGILGKKREGDLRVREGLDCIDRGSGVNKGLDK